MAGNNADDRTKIIKKDGLKDGTAAEKGVTRVYDAPAKETQVFQKHRWISDEDEDVIKPVGRNTIARGDTRIYGQSLSETRLYEKPQGQAHDGTDAGRPAKSFREAASDAAAGARRLYGDIRNVRVGDSARFAKFLKVMGVFALILLLEIGYFVFAHRTQKLPEDIEKTKKELELTRKETDILREETDALGGYDSIEEQKRSWERLKEKVEKAAAETSY